MSLIFEALKKLERERDVTERGFQVIAPTQWPARSRAARVALLSLAAAAVGGAGAWATWTFLSSRGTAAATSPAASVAAVQPAARALPPPIWESPKPAAVAPPAAVAAPRAAPAAPGTVQPVASIEPAPAPAASAPPAGATELRLEAISAQDGEAVAIINGQLVRKGDSVEGAVVTWIGVDSVELEVDGKRRVLTF